MKLSWKNGALALLAFSFPISAQAQVERLPGVVDRPLPGVNLDMREPGEAIEPGPKFVKPADANDPVAKFDSVAFKGLTTLSESRLQSIAAPYLGKTINKGELAELKYKITRAFYEEGYILVKVVTPPQSLKGGVLNIEIYEAEVGNVVIHDESNVINDHVVKSFGARTAPGKVFTETDAESMISDVNELKNLSASLNLQPGDKFKTTDLHVFLAQEAEDAHWVSADNYGSELTGHKVYSAHLEKSNLLKWGETLSTDARISEDKLWSIAGNVITPIGYRNLKLELTALRSENDIGDRLASLQATGETNLISGAISSNIINTRKDKVTTKVGIEGRNHKSFLAGSIDTKDKIRQLFLDNSYLHRAEGGIFYASARLSKGLDIFDASETAGPNATRARGNPEAFIFEPLLLVNFRPNVIPGVPNIDGEVKIVASGQMASDTLLSSDLLVTGGYGSVRGFEVAQETGETGYQFSFEYNHYLDLHPDWRVKAGPFLDGATVYNRLDGQTQDDHIYAAGIGFEAVTSLVPAGDTRFRFDIAHPIGGYTSQQVDDNRVYFSVSQNF